VICVFVTFRFGSDFNEVKVRQIAEAASDLFAGMPGLRSKLFSVEPALRTARNVYIWNDATVADAFFTAEMRARIAAIYGVEPLVEFGEVAAWVDNAGSRAT
jgi:hypothetical protein